MNLTIGTHIGKRYVIHLPKTIVKALGLKEGEKVLLKVSGNFNFGAHSRSYSTGPPRR